MTFKVYIIFQNVLNIPELREEYQGTSNLVFQISEKYTPTFFKFH